MAKAKVSAIKPTFDIEWWDTERPVDYPLNARKWKPEAVVKVAASITAYGWRQPIVVDKAGVIVIGHLRRAAARHAGLAQVPVHVAADLSPEAIRGLRLADNRTHDEAEWDMDLLAREFGELKALDFHLESTGFSLREIDKFTLSVNPAEYDVPPVPEVPVTKPGDLWIMGGHRLLCGDAAVLADVEKVLAGGLADLVFTDPPYGVEIASRTGIKGGSLAEARVLGTQNKIANDDLSIQELTELLRTAFGNLLVGTRKGACWYVTAPDGPMGLAFSIALNEIEVWRHSLVWVKDSFVMSRMDYHYRHEPIFYGWTPGGTHNAVPTRDQDTVWECPRPKRSIEHPTMKPVELVERAIRNSSNPRDTVLDTFAGSGTTVIACEKSGRLARVLEIEPRYCDCIVKRWENLTGKKAVLGDGPHKGATFEHVREGRGMESVDADIEAHLEAHGVPRV